MSKNYVLDTNVILHDPNSLKSFEDNNVIIPYPVLEELDKFKNGNRSKNFAAREALRYISTKPKNLEKVFFNDLKGIAGLINKDKVDNIILQYIITLNKEYNDPVILVSKDYGFRCKADLFDIQCEDYKTDMEDLTYDGYKKGNTNKQLLEELLQGLIPFNRAKINNIHPNEYIKYTDDIVGRYTDGYIHLINYHSVYGILPKNIEQKMAIDALLNPDVKLVTLEGKAGTGKTLLSLAAGLAQEYRKLIVTKPLIPMGKDIGYVPGDKDEKMNHWVQPIWDNIDLILNYNKEFTLEDIKERINVDALTFIRGRSIPNQFVIIDEAQNLTPHETKTIITRVGENTKIVLTGDTDQIDNPYLDKSSNGLTYTINKFKNQKISAHVRLNKGERSELATIASRIM